MKGIEAEEDCAPLRAQRFFQNWNEESVVREIEDFFFHDEQQYSRSTNPCSTTSPQETEIA